MVNISEMNLIIERAMKAFNAKNQEHLSDIFDISPSDFSRRKKRGTLIKLIEKESFRRGISYDWIKTGQGAMTTGASIGEQQASYAQNNATAPTAPDITTLPHLPPISITEDLLSKTAAIIDSQTPFASALKSNIEAFSRGLSLERDLAAYRAMLNKHTTTIEHQNKIIEEQNIRLNTFEERLKSMEEKKAG